MGFDWSAIPEWAGIIVVFVLLIFILWRTKGLTADAVTGAANRVINELQEQSTRRDRRMAALETKLDEEREKRRELGTKLTGTEIELTRAIAKIESLESDRAEWQEERAELLNRIKQLEKERGDMVRRIVQLEAELTEWRKLSGEVSG